jgi:rSAM/selenodomain-associated transferase 1
MVSSPDYLHPDTLIIIFARQPVAGQVKTRLIPFLGVEKATRLYQRLLATTLQLCQQPFSSGELLAPMQLNITPESNAAWFTDWDLASGVDIVFQSGQNLGTRMDNALKNALVHFSKAILIGTDCPFLNQDILLQSIKALDDNDMVFVPAHDGGYVLVGARRLATGCFDEIQWGTEHVMQQTRIKLQDCGLSWQELAKQHDVDDKNDLKYIPYLIE